MRSTFHWLTDSKTDWLVEIKLDLNLQDATRVSSETSFDSKQPKMEPKLVSALSETKRLFRLFRIFTETASFGVSIEPKQKKDKPKQRIFAE